MSRRGPTDAQRLWAELRRHKHFGLHSFDMRASLGIGNPSQRIADIEAQHDVEIPRRREERNGRVGKRYWHPDFAPTPRSAPVGGGAPAPEGAASSGTPRHLPADPGGESATPSSPRDAGPADGAAGMDGQADRSEPTEQLGLLPPRPQLYDPAA